MRPAPRSGSRSKCAGRWYRNEPALEWGNIETMVFRAMEPGPDELPLLGNSARRLGVRVPGDIAPNAAGDVLPGTGGMSVAPGSKWNVPNHRRPRGMLRGSTGHAGDRVYSIDQAEIVKQPLNVRPHPPGSTLHAHVEPSRQMSLVAYEDALAATRPSWIQAWP